MPFYGYKPSGAPADWGATGTLTSNQRGYRPDAMTENGWGHTASSFMGRRVAGSAATVSMAVDDSGDDLFERTDSFTVNTVMEDIAGGAIYSEPLHSCIKMRSGHVYPLRWLATVAGVGHGMIAASKISATDEKLYFRDVSNQPPPDPAGWTSSATNGHLAMWIEYEANVSPDRPDSGLEPDPGETGVSTLPFFEAFFRDDNEVVGPFGVGEADTLSQYQIQIANSDGGSPIFDSNWQNASSTEKDDRKFHYQYDGAPLSGVKYWRCRVRDDYGATSKWSSEDGVGWFMFTVGGGTVTIPSPNPTGKILTKTPATFAFRWNHSGGLSTNAVRLIVKSGTNIIRTSPIIAKTVAAAANGSISWAESTFAQLPNGLNGSYAVQGRDTTGEWSDYSTDSPFTVNAAPSVPTNPWPTAGETVNTLPEILVYVTDADDPAGSLTVTLEILDANGSLLATRAMSHQGNNWFKYQVVGGDGVTSGAAYIFQAYAYDGTFYSGGATSSANATRMPTSPFVYQVATVPVIVFPLGNQEINTTTPVYDWTFAGTQDKFRVVVWNPDNGETVYDSGIRTQSATYHTQPAGHLDNDKRNRWQVTTWEGGVATVSAPQDFSVDLDDVPELAGVTAQLHTVADGSVPTAVIVGWPQSTHEGFKEYRINFRVERDTIYDVDDPWGDKVHRVATITDPEVLTFVHHPPFNVTVFYSVRQVVEYNGATLEGESVGAEILVPFDGVVICDYDHCADKRAEFRGREERRVNRVRGSKYVTAWSERKPTRFRTVEHSREIDAEYVLFSDDPVVIENTLLDLDRMDADGGPLLYRDGRSKYLLGEIDGFVEIDSPGGLLRRVQLLFKQTAAIFVRD